ncbi:HTTM domain-containing protein [Streptomyces sp. NPDC060194]|uniref:HTTM domain-containing protein n=1 Tax=Streptomyces sp. NPDC060194 TaxID=3347069 RepID=UPI0036668097
MRRFTTAAGRAVRTVTATALGPYQSAVVRIGFAGTWLFFLLRELPHRHELYGPGSPWNWDMAQRLIAENGAFTALMWSDGRLWFEIVYAAAVVSSALLLVGWRTRTMSLLFMVGVLSLQNRAIFMGDGGDNVIHLMAMYLVLTRCGQVWSLDARRLRRDRRAGGAGGAPADRTGPVLWAVLGAVLAAVTLMGSFAGWGWPLFFWAFWAGQGLWWLTGRSPAAGSGEPRALLDVLANVLHNAALLVIMAEACLIYATAGWYKVQGGRWQDGTAVHYPLHLDYFSPWPALADLLSASGVMMLLVTYGTVAAQIAFPFTLFNRRVKNVLLAVMMVEHAVIAVVLGLPFFSLAMIAADAVFLPTGFLRRLGAGASRLSAAVAARVPARVPGRGGTKGGGEPVEAPARVPWPAAVPSSSAVPASAGARAVVPAPASEGAGARRSEADEGRGGSDSDSDRGSGPGVAGDGGSGAALAPGRGAGREGPASGPPVR